MEGTLHDGQLILVNKASYFKVNLGFLDVIPFVHVGDNSHYLFGAPRRGDVIVFRFPNQPDRDFIKRIIAVPGEQVEIHDGLVFINGKALDEKYIPDRTEHDFGPELVPDGEYFVLGDNRNNSYDSRSWGFVPEGNIIGRAWVWYWPFSWSGLISHPSIQPLGTQGDSPCAMSSWRCCARPAPCLRGISSSLLAGTPAPTSKSFRSFSIPRTRSASAG